MRAATRAVMFGVLAASVGAGTESARAAAPDSAESSRWTFFPILMYSPETSVGAGAGAVYGFALDPAPGATGSASSTWSAWSVDAMATLEVQLVLRSRLDLVRQDWRAAGWLRVQRFPTRFFPEGAHASDAGERYDEVSADLELDGRWRVTPAVSLGLRCAFAWSDVRATKDGGLLETSQPLGLGAWLAAGCGPVAALDTRDHPRASHRGVLVEVSATGYGGLTGIDFTALEARLDTRAFAALGRHVLGAQLLVETTLGVEPFQLLPRLGGASRLRGWYEGHLRGDHALLAQVEWRFPLVWKLRSAVFAALGEAADRLTTAGLRVGVGAGVRLDLDPRAGAILRLDVAWGSGLGVYFEIGEAF